MPLAMLATIALAIRPEWRRRYGPALALAAIAVFIATVLAVQSGQEFRRLVGDKIDVRTHADLANTTQIFVAVFMTGALGMAGLDRFRAGNRPTWMGSLTWVAVIVATVGSILATVWMIRTGDEGARLVWDGVVN